MKKIFGFIFLTLMCMNVNAVITDLNVRVDSTNAEIYWVGDTTLSAYYDLALVDGNTYGFFCEGAWPKEAFETGLDYMYMESDLLLNYGMNYEDVAKEQGVTEEIVETWRDGWVNNVDTTAAFYTLKPGNYLVTVTGYSSTFEKAETMNYVMFTIEQPTEGLFTVRVSNFNKIATYEGIYIIGNGQKYDVFGRKID